MNTVEPWEALILIISLFAAVIVTYDLSYTPTVPTPQPDLLDDLEIVEDTED